MPYRSFRDPEGMEWEAWDVLPQREERRTAERRAEMGPADLTFDRRRGLERRLLGLRRSSELAEGWLCFQSGAAKRRLWPIPADWPRCDDARLLAYRDAARPVRRASGRPNPSDRHPATTRARPGLDAPAELPGAAPAPRSSPTPA